MITFKKKKNIFLKRKNVDLDPRIIDKRKVRIGENTTRERTVDILTVELSCFIDQRVLLNEKIADIKVYVDRGDVSIESRRNLFNEAVSPKVKVGNSELNAYTNTSKQKSAKAARKQSKSSKRSKKSNLEFNALTLSRKQITKNLNSVVLDVDNLNQNILASKYSGLRLITKFNVDQYLAGAPIKNIQGRRQTDLELFGKKKQFKIKRTTRKAGRTKKGSRRVLSLNVPRKNRRIRIPSARNFRAVYFSHVKKGIDPIVCFTYPDNQMSLTDRRKGTKTIRKRRKNRMRAYFKKTAESALERNGNESLGFQIFSREATRRNRVYKTQFRVSRRRLLKYSRDTGTINLVYYAFDDAGRRVDSFKQEVQLSKLFATQINPSLDFDINCSRTLDGRVFTKIRNFELHPGRYNVYQKDFSRSQGYERIGFQEAQRNLPIGPRNEIRLVDGKQQKASSPTFSKTKTIFQRTTLNFKRSEYGNTKASSVASQDSVAEQMSCAIYVVQETDTDNANVRITNLSEDVFAILPVKRIARGTRGSDFEPLQIIVDGKFIDQPKVFVNRDSPEDTIDFSFEDVDVQDDTVYEYAVFLYNRSGHKQISGNRFLEKRNDRENLVSTRVNTVKKRPSQSSLDEPSVYVEFEVILDRQEDDVDKIINSIFGDNAALFNDDLKSIKDASNLLYGVRVHRIDTETGEYSFVGSFRGFKQESSGATASTDIPKTYRAIVRDNAPAFSRQIYKFDPYIVPPAQVLDKVFVSLENIVKNKSRSRATLNKLLVSKQKIINRSVISKIGTKYASSNGRRGSISSKKSFLEKNKNDLFLEGTTGDIVYKVLRKTDTDSSVGSLVLQDQSINLLKTLDRDPKTKRFIPKRVFDMEFKVGPIDALVDFYVVVRQENKDPNISIDGAIHSTDRFRKIPKSKKQPFVKYKYLSESNARVGLVRYYLFGVTKSGALLGPGFIGGITMEDD